MRFLKKAEAEEMHDITEVHPSYNLLQLNLSIQIIISIHLVLIIVDVQSQSYKL